MATEEKRDQDNRCDQMLIALEAWIEIGLHVGLAPSILEGRVDASKSPNIAASKACSEKFAEGRVPEKGLIAEHEDTISKVEKFLNFARQVDNSPASTSKILELRVELPLCTDVNAARRIVKDDDPGRHSKRAAN